MRSLYAALLGVAVAGAPLSAQVVGQVPAKAAPNEEQHIALTQQQRMIETFARRIQIADAGEEEDVRANVEKLGTAIESAGGALDALARVTDTTQTALLGEIRGHQGEIKKHFDELKAEVAKSPMQLRVAKTHADAIMQAAEQAEAAHAKMLPKQPEPPKSEE